MFLVDQEPPWAARYGHEAQEHLAAKRTVGFIRESGRQRGEDDLVTPLRNSGFVGR